jgi:hypothetical protein
MAAAKSVSASDKFEGFGIEIDGNFFAGKVAAEKPTTKKGK